MIVYILNLFDLLCTLCVLKIGLRELNPFLQSVPFMVLYKVVIVGALIMWLSYRPEPLARLGLRICTVVYGGLAVYHIYGISIL